MADPAPNPGLWCPSFPLPLSLLVPRGCAWLWLSSQLLFLTQILAELPQSLWFLIFGCPRNALYVPRCLSCRSSQPSQLPDTSTINFHLLSSCQKSEQAETLEELYRNPCLDAHLLLSPPSPWHSDIWLWLPALLYHHVPVNEFSAGPLSMFPNESFVWVSLLKYVQNNG